MKYVKLTIPLNQAMMLANAAGQMEDDYSRIEGQTWKEFELSVGITKAESFAFHDGLKALWAAIHKARKEEEK